MLDESGQADALIRRLKTGDRTAGDELFTLLYPRLVRLAKLMLGTFPDVRFQHECRKLRPHAWIDLQTALKTVPPEDSRRYLGLAVQKARFALLDIAKKERRRLDTVPLKPGSADLRRLRTGLRAVHRLLIRSRTARGLDQIP